MCLPDVHDADLPKPLHGGASLQASRCCGVCERDRLVSSQERRAAASQFPTGGRSDAYAQREFPHDLAESLCLGAGQQAGKRQVERLPLALAGTQRHAPRCAAALHGRPERRPHSRRTTGGAAGGRGHTRPCRHANADAQLTPDDLKAWEQQHGPIPAGAVVALFSGWDARVGDARKFFGLDDKGGYHFPGFHVEAVQFLQERRKVKGIATDTLSLDPGPSADFPVHHYWLGRQKWGLENVAELGPSPSQRRN